jgi:small subunit ribosomal protein S13
MYLLNYNLQIDKKIYIELKKIFGLGLVVSLKITKKLGFCKNTSFKLLTKNQVLKFKKVMSFFSFFLSDNLKKFQMMNFKRVLRLNLLKAVRKLKGLPVRGQRTKTNSKTAKKKL